MTPLLNAAVYYFIFGVLLNTRHGVEDFVPFLVTGVFIWTFTSSSITAGTRAISGNIGLVRALHFPGPRCRWRWRSSSCSSCCSRWAR